MVSCSEGGPELAAGDRLLRFPAIWLRDNCPCAECLDPGSGQKLKDITDIPNGLMVSAAQDAGESVLVTYAPDRHVSTFTRDPVPTVQLLHCLRGADRGGDTGLVDGFAAAAALRAVDAQAFDVLARTPVAFGYTDSGTELRGQPAAHPAQPARPGPGCRAVTRTWTAWPALSRS
jgi:hypothetical protein